MKITAKILDRKVETLNTMTKNCFTIDYAYGGYRLSKICNNSGGIADMSERVTAAEMSRILDSIINVLRTI